jgi:hypothetical protein
MKKVTLLLGSLLLLAVALPVWADGKFYSYEEIPPEIPYQRALLAFAGGQETMVLQSKYQVTASQTASVGWVVPVPSVPDLDSIDAGSARLIFDMLDMATSPRELRVRTLLVLFLLAGVPVLLLVGLLSLLVRRTRPKGWQWWLLVTWAALGCLAVIFVVMFDRPSAQDARRGIAGVEVIKAEQVGIYDVQVIRSDDATALLEWLDEHQFRFDEADTLTFDDYLRRGWVFVVANVDPSAAQAGSEAVHQGLVAPLILRFQAETPVYPLALTATAGHETQILLYLLGQGKWQNDGRLDLHYAGETPYSLLRLLDDERRPEGFLAGAEETLPFLCKFKGTLLPEEMAEDLVFRLAKNDRPYRKRVIKW